MRSQKFTCNTPSRYEKLRSSILYRKNYSRMKLAESISATEMEIVASLKEDGFVVLPNYIPKDKLSIMQKELQHALECLQFNTPVLSQSRIDPTHHQELIDNFLFGTKDQLQKWGVLFDRAEISSLEQALSEFSPSTLTVPMLSLSETYRKVWLNPSILRIVSHYLGMVPTLSEAYVRRNFPASYRTMNHYWHRDLNSTHLLKAFVFLSDCDSTNGPHEYISQTHRKFDVLNGKRYFSDQEVDDLYSPDNIQRKESIVSAGTIIIEDTRGLHRAALPTTGWRDLGYMVFMPLRPFYPHHNYSFPKDALEQLSTFQKAFIPSAMLD